MSFERSVSILYCHKAHKNPSAKIRGVPGERDVIHERDDFRWLGE